MQRQSLYSLVIAGGCANKREVDMMFSGSRKAIVGYHGLIVAIINRPASPLCFPCRWYQRDSRGKVEIQMSIVTDICAATAAWGGGPIE